MENTEELKDRLISAIEGAFADYEESQEEYYEDEEVMELSEEEEDEVTGGGTWKPVYVKGYKTISGSMMGSTRTECVQSGMTKFGKVTSVTRTSGPAGAKFFIKNGYIYVERSSASIKGTIRGKVVGKLNDGTITWNLK